MNSDLIIVLPRKYLELAPSDRPANARGSRRHFVSREEMAPELKEKRSSERHGGLQDTDLQLVAKEERTSACSV